MEKTTSILYVSIALGLGSLVNGCMFSEQKKQAANDKVVAAKDNLSAMEENADALAEKEATADELKTFKLESVVKIKNNEVSIAELKLKMNKSGHTQDKDFVKKIDLLEVRNKDLKVRMGNYEFTHSDWSKFKVDFNRDLNEVAFRLKELVKKDKNILILKTPTL
jgi:hypothetical protein